MAMDGPLNILMVIFDITKDTESSSNMSVRVWVGMVCVEKLALSPGSLLMHWES